MKPFYAAAVAALALCAAATPARAANLVWGPATNISADTDVNNTGMTVGAFRLGNTGLTSATVNGVTFMSLGVPDNTVNITSGNFKLNFIGGTFSSNTGFGTTVAPYGNLPAATQNLLQSGSFDQSGQITLTMSGLTIGQGYTFEYWANNAGNFTSFGAQQVKATGGTGMVTLLANTSKNSNGQNSSALGGVGQFATGTFTADAASQVITFTSPNDVPELNAFQLRTAAPAAAPEPSQTAALGLGALGVAGLLLRAKKRRAVSA